MSFNTNEKVVITKIIQRFLEYSPRICPLILFLQAVSPNQICSAWDEMLIKRFDTFLESPVDAQWITADSAGCAENQ